MRRLFQGGRDARRHGILRHARGHGFFLAAALLLAAPALAEDPHHPEPQTHGASAHGGPDAHGDEAHGEDHGGEHHADYTGDADHDGTLNFMDSDSEDFVLGGLGLHFINLVLLLALLFFVARRPIADAMSNRAHDIKKELTDTARARDEAKQRHDELAARLAAFESEVAALRATADAEAREEETRLVARAEDEARRIGEAAERSVRDELVRARYALRKDAVDLAVKLAENTLKNQVQAEDQRRLAQQFLESLNREVNGHG